MLPQSPLFLLDSLLLQKQLGLSLYGLLIIDNFLLHLLNGFGISVRDKEAVEMNEVRGCGFALHTQLAVAQVVVGGGLQLVGSHGEEPATDHDQSTN